MILKASQRGGAADLAQHLMNVTDNEHMTIHDLRGFASDNLRDAFQEVQAAASGTKCKQYLFSLSLSPPEGAVVPVAAFESAIGDIEAEFGLEAQPRAIVFHEKEGRRHAHCVWSRIDADTMTAHQMSFFKNRLRDISRDLYLEHGWTLPKGLLNAAERNPTNFTLAEWQQAKRQEIDPRWLKTTVQNCWQSSDSRKSFEGALADNALFLARGDRRGHVVMDHKGEVWALSRLLDVKAKDVRAMLGDGSDLRSVDETKVIIGERLRPAIRRHVEEARAAFKAKTKELDKEKEALVEKQRKERADLQHKHTINRHLNNLMRAKRLPTGARAVWSKMTGEYKKIQSQNRIASAHELLSMAIETEMKIKVHNFARSLLQDKYKDLRKEQAAQLAELRRDMGRFMRFSRGQDSREPSRSQSEARAFNTGQSLKLIH